VLGSGASISYLSPRFFDDKICIATNLIANHFDLRAYYLFTHYHYCVLENLAKPGMLAAVAHDVCSSRWHPNPGSIPGEGCVQNEARLIYNTLSDPTPKGDGFDPYKHAKDDEIVFGSSSIHGSMHLAAWMGAKNIMLVGADCGSIDGQHRVDEYPAGHQPWDLYNRHLMRMKAWLNDKYSVEVYSLNPFVNFNLEGHTFQGV
jgi:hypothetical protein